LKPVFGDILPDKVKKRQKDEYDYWLDIQKEFEETRKEAEMNYQFTSSIQDNLTEVAKMLRSTLGKEEIYAQDLENLKNQDDRVIQAAAMVLQIFEQMGGEVNSFQDVLTGLAQEVNYY